MAKYDPSGNYIFGGTYDGNVYALTIDAASNIWVTGSMADSIDLDLGPGRAMFYAIDKKNYDVYLVKYSSGLAYLNAGTIQSNSTVVAGEGVAVNQKGSAFAFGRYGDSVDCNPGGPGGRLIAAGSGGNYLAKYNASSALLQAYSLGSTNAFYIYDMAVNKRGAIWTAGRFTGTLDLDFGPGTSNVTSTTAASYIAQYADAETETATTGVNQAGSKRLPVKVWGGDDAVVVDFSGLEHVNAHVKVVNMLGQTVAEADHHQCDMLRIQLPNAAPQIYVTVVSNEGKAVAEKVWVR